MNADIKVVGDSIYVETMMSGVRTTIVLQGSLFKHVRSSLLHGGIDCTHTVRGSADDEYGLSLDGSGSGPVTVHSDDEPVYTAAVEELPE